MAYTYGYRRDLPLPTHGGGGGARAASSGRSDGGRGVLRRKRQARVFALFMMVGAVFQYASVSGIFETTMPNSRVLRRMLMSRFFGRDRGGGGSEDDRYLSKNKGGGDCEWAAPVKLNATYNPPRTLLVSYPGSGKRLVWRMIEGLTGFVTGDDWDLSLEGKNVASMKTSYPHREGVWTWRDKMKDAKIVLLIRNPRWAIPSYQTMMHELGYSNSWVKSFRRRPNTYTVRPDIAEWEQWRGDTWPNSYKPGRADREINRWAWFIDFWMREGLRTYDDGTSFIDWHCRNASMRFGLSPNMNSCRPAVIISFEKLYGEGSGPAESQKLADALEAGRPDMPMIEREARDCVFSKTKEKRGSEERWDNTARDGNGPDVTQKNFTWLQLQHMKSELERLIANYTVAPWDIDPLAQDLVSNLEVYLSEVDAEIDTTSPYTWWPTSSPTPAPTPAPMVSPTPIPTATPTFNPNYFAVSDTTDWIMGRTGQSCTDACSTYGDPGASCDPLAQDNVDDATKMSYVAGTVGQTCSVLSITGLPELHTPAFVVTDDLVGPTCLYHLNLDPLVEEILPSDCETALLLHRRLCCCGANCPVAP